MSPSKKEKKCKNVAYISLYTWNGKAYVAAILNIVSMLKDSQGHRQSRAQCAINNNKLLVLARQYGPQMGGEVIK